MGKIRFLDDSVLPYFVPDLILGDHLPTALDKQAKKLNGFRRYLDRILAKPK